MPRPRTGGRGAPPKAPAAAVGPGHALSDAERTLVSGYCRTGGDLELSAERAGLALDVARRCVSAPWWAAECRAYWREHPPTVEQAALFVRDTLADESVGTAARLKAAQLAMEHHSRERVAGALEDLIGMARNGQSDRLLLEMIRRPGLMRLPPEQYAILVAHAERLVDASDDVVTIDVTADDAASSEAVSVALPAPESLDGYTG